MATVDTAITRAETDLDQLQSALDAARQVVEVVGTTERMGRRVVKSLKVVIVVLAAGGLVVLVALLCKRLLNHFHGIARTQELPSEN